MPLHRYGCIKEIEPSDTQTAMDMVIKELLKRPHTAASLTQKIGIYSASHINHCLRDLKKAGLIDTLKKPYKYPRIYYNKNLDMLN